MPSVIVTFCWALQRFAGNPGQIATVVPSHTPTISPCICFCSCASTSPGVSATRREVTFSAKTATSAAANLGPTKCFPKLSNQLPLSALYVTDVVEPSTDLARQAGAALGPRPRLAAKVAAPSRRSSPNGCKGRKSRIARIKCVVVREQKLDDEPEDDRRAHQSCRNREQDNHRSQQARMTRQQVTGQRRTRPGMP